VSAHALQSSRTCRWVDQRRDVDADDVHLEFLAFVGVDDGFYYGLVDLAAMQICADFIADLELARRLFLGHGIREVPEPRRLDARAARLQFYASSLILCNFPAH